MYFSILYHTIYYVLYYPILYLILPLPFQEQQRDTEQAKIGKMVPSRARKRGDLVPSQRGDYEGFRVQGLGFRV